MNYRGYTIEISHDELPEHPRINFDTFGHLICFHKKYVLCDSHSLKAADFTGWNDLKEYLIKQEKAAIILPVYLFDHSGLSVKIGPFNHPYATWDSGQIGFIYCTNVEIIKEYGSISKQSVNNAEKLLYAEISTYNQYLQGDIYCYTITDKENILDSCCGIYGYDYCIDQAKSQIDYIISKTGEQLELSL